MAGRRRVKASEETGVSGFRYSELFDDVAKFLKHLKEDYGLSSDEIIDIITKQTGKKISKDQIPVSIFENDKLSAFEAIVKYLKEDAGKKLRDIAVSLERTDGAIWTTYNNAKKKMGSRLKVVETKFSIPLLIIKNRKLSVLENIVKHLKEVYGLSYHEIAVMLNRNDRTIWTVYNRAKKK